MRGASEGVDCFPTGRHYPGIAHLLRIVVAGLAEEYAGETPIGGLRMVCIDTETTGRDPDVDSIVEIGCVVWQNGDVISRKSWLVNPGRPIPKEASDVHGIKDEDVAGAEPFSAVIHEVLELAAGCVPVAYNAEYDRKVLAAEVARANVGQSALSAAAANTTVLPLKQPPCLRRGVEWIDPLVWARELQKSERSRSLSEVCERLGIALESAHRAMHDAEATLRVLGAFLRDARVPQTYAGFMQEQRRLFRLFEADRPMWRR